MKKVGIIGFGRFGELLARLCSDTFEVTIIEQDINKQQKAGEYGYDTGNINSIPTFDYIFLAVPISAMEDVLKQIGTLVDEKQVVIDVCSVKVYPTQLMKKYLKNAQILATHPLFGPDSAKQGLKSLRVAFCSVRVTAENVQVIKNFWEKKGADVIETTPEQHDKDSVYSLAFTHSIAKIILSMKLPDVTFTTKSFNAIKQVAEFSANDTEELFHDMLFYNPYFKDMKVELEKAMEATGLKLDEIESEQVLAGPFSTMEPLVSSPI